MPLCQIVTNRPNEELKDGMEERIAKCLAETLNKPLGRMIITVVPGARVYRLQNSEPACSVTIHALNVFDEERSPKYVDSIKQCIMEELDLPRERIMLLFFNLELHQVGV